MADSEDELTQTDDESPSPDAENYKNTENTAKTPQSPKKVHPRGKSNRPAVQVNLSKVKRRPSPHKPSLPTPLTEYGLDERKQARAKARAEREQKEKKRKRSTTFYSDEEKDREKEKLKDEKYMQVLEDLKKLRNYYYLEYRDKLDTKVTQQRKDIRLKKEVQQRKQQLQEDKEREAAHRVRKRHDHHKLQHDDSYMKNVPKSDVYLILGLQEKLLKEGKLRGQDDLDRFWMEMRKPQVFFSHFPDGLAATSSIHQSIVTSAMQSPGREHTHSLSQIAESKESSRPTTHDTWAVTQRYSHIHQATESPSQRGLTLSPSRQAAVDLEKRFPKLEMPPLHCFSMDLGQKPPDPEEMQLKMDLKAKEKQRRKFLKKLHKMHQLAMANSAAATSSLRNLRILDRHSDLAFLSDGPDLTDLISDYYLETYETAPPLPQASRRLPPISGSEAERELASELPPTIVARMAMPEDELSTDSRGSSTKSRQEKKVEQQLVLYEPSKPLPLTMEEVRDKGRVVEAKALSSFWPNYMHVGRNVFLASSS
ncbi:E3 ubiquitin-protein ligase BRE1A-like isoform X1 [Haliotis cracherodii]|uniref:E3 ubiquitin-protein ligase BRE1A-like isoform X1 n=1 Tax=Haliotis cracherodii TaxID=6455 RepID=UPI0039E7B6F3